MERSQLPTAQWAHHHLTRSGLSVAQTGSHRGRQVLRSQTAGAGLRKTREQMTACIQRLCREGALATRRAKFVGGSGVSGAGVSSNGSAPPGPHPGTILWQGRRFGFSYGSVRLGLSSAQGFYPCKNSHYDYGQDNETVATGRIIPLWPTHPSLPSVHNTMDELDNQLDSLYSVKTSGYLDYDGRHVSGQDKYVGSLDCIPFDEFIVASDGAEQCLCVVIQIPSRLSTLFDQLIKHQRICEQQPTVVGLPLVFYRSRRGFIEDIVYPGEFNLTPESLPELSNTISMIKQFAEYAGGTNLEDLLFLLPPSRLLACLRSPPQGLAESVKKLSLSPHRDALREAVEQGDWQRVELYRQQGANLTALYTADSNCLGLPRPKNLLTWLLRSPQVRDWANAAHQDNPQKLAEQTQLGKLLYHHGCYIDVNEDLIRKLPSLAAYMMAHGERCHYLWSIDGVFQALALYITDGVIDQDELATIIQGIKRLYVLRLEPLDSGYTGFVNRMLKLEGDLGISSEIPNIHCRPEPLQTSQKSVAQRLLAAVAVFAPLGLMLDTKKLRDDLHKCRRNERADLNAKRLADLASVSELVAEIKGEVQQLLGGPLASLQPGGAPGPGSGSGSNNSYGHYCGSDEWPVAQQASVNRMLGQALRRSPRSHFIRLHLALRALGQRSGTSGTSGTRVQGQSRSTAGSLISAGWPAQGKQSPQFERLINKQQGKWATDCQRQSLNGPIDILLNGLDAKVRSWRIFDPIYDPETRERRPAEISAIVEDLVCGDIEAAQARVERLYESRFQHIDAKQRAVEALYQQLDEIQNQEPCRRARADFVSREGQGEQGCQGGNRPTGQEGRQTEPFNWLRALFSFAPDTAGKNYLELAQVAINHYYRMPQPNQVEQLAKGPPLPDLLNREYGVDHATRMQVLAEALLELLAHHDQGFNSRLEQHPDLWELIPLAMVYVHMAPGAGATFDPQINAAEYFVRDMSVSGRYPEQLIGQVARALASHGSGVVEPEEYPIVRVIRLVERIDSMRAAHLSADWKQIWKAEMGANLSATASAGFIQEFDVLLEGAKDLAYVTGGAPKSDNSRSGSYFHRHRLCGNEDKRQKKVDRAINALECVRRELDDMVRRILAQMAGLVTCAEDHSEQALQRYDGRIPCLVNQGGRDRLTTIHSELELRQILLPKGMTTLQKLIFSQAHLTSLPETMQMEIRQEVIRLSKHGIRPPLGRLSQAVLRSPLVRKRLRDDYQLDVIAQKRPCPGEEQHRDPLFLSVRPIDSTTTTGDGPASELGHTLDGVEGESGSQSNQPTTARQFPARRCVLL